MVIRKPYKSWQVSTLGEIGEVQTNTYGKRQFNIWEITKSNLDHHFNYFEDVLIS